MPGGNLLVLAQEDARYSNFRELVTMENERLITLHFDDIVQPRIMSVRGHIEISSASGVDGTTLDIRSTSRDFRVHHLIIFTMVGFAIGVAAAHFS